MVNYKNEIKNEQWALAKGTHYGLPLLVRFRHDLSRQTIISNHSQLIKIYWEFGKDLSGMPSGEESNEMGSFENRLVEELKNDLSGVLVGVVTTNGFREWVYYTKNIDVFSDKLHHMPQEQNPYPIKIEAHNDPNWDYYFTNIYTEI